MAKVNKYYYTYAFLREDKTPYYIGKGRGKRIYSKNRTINAPKDKSRIIFLKQNLTEEEAFKHEIYMIALYGRKDLGTGILHNHTDGGEGVSGYTHTEEELKKMSELNSGENHPLYGKKHTPEARKKMSEAKSGENHPMYGKKLSSETLKKMSEAKKGKKLSPETRKKMSEAKKNMSIETRKKMSEAQSGENNPMYGKKRPKHSKRMSGENNPLYGKKHTPEARKKMSEARKKYLENKKLQELNK